MSTHAPLSVSVGTHGGGPPWQSAICPWRAVSTVSRLVTHEGQTLHGGEVRLQW